MSLRSFHIFFSHWIKYYTCLEPIRRTELTSTADAFSEWVKHSGANLSVTISFAWNQLMEDNVFQSGSVPDSWQAELIASLHALEALIQMYGMMDGFAEQQQQQQQQEQDGALQYAKAILRFTQTLHDYLEEKDRRELVPWPAVEHDSCYEDLVAREDGQPMVEGACACYKCRVAWSDGSEQCPCEACTPTKEMEAGRIGWVAGMKNLLTGTFSSLDLFVNLT